MPILTRPWSRETVLMAVAQIYWLSQACNEYISYSWIDVVSSLVCWSPEIRRQQAEVGVVLEVLSRQVSQAISEDTSQMTRMRALHHRNGYNVPNVSNGVRWGISIVKMCFIWVSVNTIQLASVQTVFISPLSDIELSLEYFSAWAAWSCWWISWIWGLQINNWSD